MARRSNVIVILGLAVFLVGAAATYFLVRGGGGDTVASPASGGVEVLYAANDIPAGTTGATALSQGLVKSKSISAATKPVSALTDSAQLASRAAPVGIPQGSVLTDDSFPMTQTRVGTVKIPDGKTALALQLTNVPGVAGYAGAGDKINIYALSEPDGGKSESKLIMQNTEILSVNGANLTPSPGVPGAGDLVFLVAVTPPEAERLTYLTHFEKLYFSLVPRDQGPVPPTSGVDAATALEAL